MSRMRSQLKKLSLSSLLGDGKSSGKDDNIGMKRTTTTGRKKLPTVPTDEEQSNMKESIRLRSPVITDHLAAYGPFFLEYSILAEFNHLQKQKIPGVYAIPSLDNPLVWHGVIFIRMGIYQDGIFRFKLNVPKNYPDGDCPSLTFTKPVFHPVVHPETGQVDIQRAFKTWRPNVNHLWQVLLYMRRIFYKIDTDQPLNKEAADLYQTNQDAFKERVRENVATSLENIYDVQDRDNDGHEIIFTKWNQDLHEPIKQEILSDKNRLQSEISGAISKLELDNSDTAPSISGFSFMEPGSTIIFSKEDNT